MKIPGTSGMLSEIESLKLIHEMEVHQIELEMQNDELKKAIDIAQLEEEKFRSLAIISPVGIYITDKEGACTYVNEAWCRMAGLNFKEALGDGWINGIFPDDRSNISKTWKKYLNTGNNWNWEYRFQDKSGKITWVYGIATPIKNPQGETLGYIGNNFDITSRKHSEDLLKESEDKLRQYSEELLELTRHREEVRENERSRIAHDLHDDLGQKLTAINMDIAWLKSRIGVQTPLVESKIKQMVQLLNMTIESVQQISFGLRPSILDNLGLRAAIEWQVREFNKSTGISCSLSFHFKETELHSECSLMVFRLIQEALTNITRHSEATEVSIKLDAIDNSLKIIIKDNGKGIENEKILSNKTLGLIGMKERVNSFKGTINIKGTPGKGTEIVVNIPVGG